MELRTLTLRPAWAEVDLGAIRGNVQALCALLGPGTKLLAVVKANGYGHGAVEVAKACLQAGASWLGVAIPEEALSLREAGISAPILILGYMPPQAAEAVVDAELSAAVFSEQVAQALSRASRKLGKPARVHLKVDTGMGRLGVSPEGIRDFVRRIRQLPGLLIEGVFTHFATADEEDLSYCRQQLERFYQVLEVLEGEGLPISLRHAANSAATLSLPESHLDMVRVGLALYGIPPAIHLNGKVPLKPAMALKGRVAFVKRVPPGTSISYGRTYTTRRETVVATIPIGYADGYPRSLSNRGYVLLKNRRLPVIGRVCMDHFMVDATEVAPVEEGEEVMLFGPGLPVEEVAEWAGTIPYEILTGVSSRVPRVYHS
ncbi:MAG: alanine racemase [Armatimonadota bacterium]|nr:alanine racemase [Armatimonadota bacterium]